MKRLSTILFLSTIISCTSKSKPLVKYDLEIYKDELEVVGDNLVPNVKKSIILAETDSIAYQKALIDYYSNLKTEKLFEEKGIKTASVTKGFKLTDTAGVDVEILLSKPIVDKLTLEIKKSSGL